MRISRALALAGIDSRRKCEQHVLNGAVQVNGEVVTDLGRQVDPANDAVLFRGKPLGFGAPVYYVLNKPKGYITSTGDPHASKTVYELLPHRLSSSTRQANKRQRVFPVGRLDKDTMGLLLFTNDGDLAHRLIHPRFGVSKAYEVRLDRAFDARDKKRVLGGIRLAEGMARVEKIRLLSPRVLQLMIREGKKREVRRIFEKLGYEVVRLVRFGFGTLTLGGLPLGRGRFLNKKEIDALKKIAESKRA